MKDSLQVFDPTQQNPLRADFSDTSIEKKQVGYCLTEQDRENAKTLLKYTKYAETGLQTETINIEKLLDLKKEVKKDLLKDLIENYTFKTIGLAYLPVFKEMFTKLTDHHEFFQWLSGIIEKNPNQNLKIIDDIIRIYVDNPRSTYIEDTITTLITIIQYNNSDKAIESCEIIGKKILNTEIKESFIEKLSKKAKEKKLNEIKEKKSADIRKLMDAVNEIVNKFNEDNRHSAINDSFKPLHSLFETLRRSEQNGDFSFKTDWKSDRILESLTKACMNLKKSNFWNNNKENFDVYVNKEGMPFYELFDLLIQFHSSYDLKYCFMEQYQLAEFFSINTLGNLLEKDKDEGIKKNCIEYLCSAYKKPHLAHYKHGITTCISKFIQTTENSHGLRIQAFDQFSDVLGDEKEKRDFINKRVHELFNKSKNLNLQCPICKPSEQITSIDFAFKLYECMQKNAEKIPHDDYSYSDFLKSKSNLQHNIEMEIYRNNAQFPKRKRDYFFNLVTKEYKEDIKKIQEYSKELINKIIETQPQKSYAALFSSEQFKQSDLIKLEMKLWDLFNKVDDTIIQEFSNIKEKVWDNIDTNIFYNIEDLDPNEMRTHREKYFDYKTQDMSSEETIKYTQDVMEKMIHEKAEESSVCFFCKDGEKIQDVVDYLLIFYKNFDNKHIDNTEIKDDLRKKIMELALELSDIKKKQETFDTVTESLSIGEFSEFSSKIVSKLIEKDTSAPINSDRLINA